MKRRKSNKYLILFVLLLGITMGYAAISTTLKINGTVGVNKNTWNIYWDNAVVTSSNTSQAIPTIGQDQGEPLNTKVSWQTTFALPGDYYEFTVDAVNAGTVDAMITNISSKVNGSDISTLPDYIKYTVTYADGIVPEVHHLLPKAKVVGNTSTPTREKYRVRVEYDYAKATSAVMNSMPSGGLSLEFNFSVTYGQATNDAVDLNTPSTLEEDSWPKIARVVKNNSEAYPLGATKTIQLDDDDDGVMETYHLRVANNTTPSECNTTGFSQTACGFVLEFVEVLAKDRQMNKLDTFNRSLEYNSNGSWEHSIIRGYMNSTFFNKLPSELRSRIIDTYVVSGHNEYISGATNFYSTDKIYFFDPIEVWNANPNNKYTAADSTRQLDYYESQNTSLSNLGPAIKNKVNGLQLPTDWHLRSAYNNYIYDFYLVKNDGGWATIEAHLIGGVSPAFRLG